MHKHTLLLLLLFCGYYLKAQNLTPIEKGLDAITKNSLEAQLTFFSSDWFEGREAGTKGAYMASDYLSSLYHELRLKPIHDQNFLNTVPLIVAKTPHRSTIRLNKEGKSVTYAAPNDLRTERIAQSYKIEAPIIWVGYGLNTNSFKELNLKETTGKIIIRLKGLPTPLKDSNPLAKLIANKTPQELMNNKQNTITTSKHVAILEYDINDPHLKKSFDRDSKHHKLASAEKQLNKRSSGIYEKSFFLPSEKNNHAPYYQISQTVIRDLIPNFDEQLKHYHNNLNQNKTVAVKTDTDKTIVLSSEANTELITCRNVIAMIEGSEHPDEIIVVGAHYDHLGTYNGYIWNGADDNGSGAIGVVAIAKAFVATGTQPKRTVIFANWTAEERGLLGSRYFVDTFKDIDKVKYYHNYDMIGRSYNYEKSDSTVSLLYTKSWKQAEELCDKNNQNFHLNLKINFSPWDNPTSGSDNAPFAKKGIPIMWFHTGGHEAYHMPNDHVEKIDWQKYTAIVKTSFATLWQLANE